MMEHVSPESPDSRLLTTMDATSLILARRTVNTLPLLLGPVTVSITLVQCPQQALKNALQPREPAAIRLRLPGTVIGCPVVLMGPLPKGSIPAQTVKSGSMMAELRKDMIAVCRAELRTKDVQMLGRYDKDRSPMFLYMDFSSADAANAFGLQGDRIASVPRPLKRGGCGFGRLPRELLALIRRREHWDTATAGSQRACYADHGGRYCCASHRILSSGRDPCDWPDSEHILCRRHCTSGHADERAVRLGRRPGLQDRLASDFVLGRDDGPALSSSGSPPSRCMRPSPSRAANLKAAPGGLRCWAAPGRSGRGQPSCRGWQQRAAPPRPSRSPYFLAEQDARAAAHAAAPAGAASQRPPHHEPADGLPDDPVRPGSRMGGRGGAVIPPCVELCTRAHTHTH